MLAEKTTCCGCGLCEYVCTEGAIVMVQDEEGFYYPQINKDKCTGCHKCNRLCPVLKEGSISGEEKMIMEKVYAGYQREREILLKSSSGGAAYTIAHSFIQQGGVVFGVAYDEDYKGASFVFVENSEELSKLQESKYVESKRRVLFDKISTELGKGNKVLVIGLPCDIAAVKSLVGDRDDLYTCKLCCRSNTSNKALQQFIAKLEKQYLSTVVKLSLRYKEKDAPRFPTKCRVDFANGKVFISDFTKTDYGKAFQILARPSCLECKAKSMKGLADITLGDFQGADPQREYYNTNGLSLIAVHTMKGKKLKELLENFYLKEMPYDDVMSYNWMASESIPKSPLRDQFSADFVQEGLENACLRLVREQNEKIDEIADEMTEKQLRVALWGAGDTAENLYDRFRMDKWNLKYVYDSSRLKVGSTFRDMEIMDLKMLAGHEDKIDILAVMIPSEKEEKLNEILAEIGWKKPVIHTGKYKFYKG